MGKNAAYAAQYAEEAKEQMRRYGIPASVILAQAILERSNGQSQLSRECNNHFGIKATASWLKNGGEYGVYSDDRPNEKFCKYKSVGDSYASLAVPEAEQALCAVLHAVARRLQGMDEGH